MKYYETSDKNYEKVYIMNSNKMYQICDSLNISISKGDNYDCFFLIMDIKTVYTSYLMPMNKYKLNDLQKNNEPQAGSLFKTKLNSFFE